MADAESSALSVFAAELRAQRARLGWTQVTLGDKTWRPVRLPCPRESGVPGQMNSGPMIPGTRDRRVPEGILRLTPSAVDASW